MPLRRGAREPAARRARRRVRRPGLRRTRVAGVDEESWKLLLDYNHRLGQAFSSTHVASSCTAIGLWSLAIVRTRRLARGIGFYGLLLAPLILIVHLSGHMHLDVHGMGAVVLGQGIWFIATGAALWRMAER